MKTFAITVLLSLPLACATPSGDDFHKGTYRSPPAVAPTTPGAGAPTYEPGTRMHPPRSPHSRIIPQDEKTRKEPGLWRGNESRASGEVDDDPLPLFPPLPENSSVWEAKADSLCRSVVPRFENMGIGMQSRDWYNKQPKLETRCVSNRLYLQCVGHFHNEMLSRHPDGNPPSPYGQLFEKTKSFVTEKCGKVELSSDVRAVLNSAINWMRESHPSASGGKTS